MIFSIYTYLVGTNGAMFGTKVVHIDIPKRKMVEYSIL